MYTGSIVYNISLWRENVNKESLDEACRVSLADDVIASKKEGMYYNIGANGAGLSGGQKQRLGIARTLAGCPGLLTGIVCNVLIQSLAFIVQMLGFVFGVTLVFGMLEEIGVMARISYVFDNTMGKLGLQGKSVMPFLVSFGCTMGGAAGARVIDNWGQKVLTIALAWAVPCGAAWSIIPMLSTMFFGPGAVLVIIVVLLVMLLHMWVTAKIFACSRKREIWHDHGTSSVSQT